MPPSSVSLGSPNRNDRLRRRRSTAIRKWTMIATRSASDEAAIAHRTTVASLVGDDVRPEAARSWPATSAGCVIAPRRRFRRRTSSTNADRDQRAGPGPSSRATRSRRSPKTVLPMSSVIWLVSVVIGWVSAVGHRRPVADDHLDGERLAGGPHHAQHDRGQECRPGRPGRRMCRIVCQRVVPERQRRRCAGPAGRRGTTS